MARKRKKNSTFRVRLAYPGYCAGAHEAARRSGGLTKGTPTPKKPREQRSRRKAH